MPVSKGFTDFVVEQLDGCGVIATRRMFGGVGIYCGDLFFAIIDNDVLYLKVDEMNRPDFEGAGSGPFRPYGDDRETMQYYNVPVAVLEDAAELSEWGKKAIAAAKRKRSGIKPATRRVAAGTVPRTQKSAAPRKKSGATAAKARARRGSRRG